MQGGGLGKREGGRRERGPGLLAERGFAGSAASLCPLGRRLSLSGLWAVRALRAGLSDVPACTGPALARGSGVHRYLLRLF